MNIEQLNTYIANKEALDENAILQIMQLIEKYPYFQTGHMLLLKAMHKSQPEKYNGQLKISASFISDKKKLYQYIHSDIYQNKAEPEKKEIQKSEKVIEVKKTDKTQDRTSIGEIKEKTIKGEDIITKQKIEEKVKIPEKEKSIETINLPEKEKIIEKPETEKIKVPEIEKIIGKEKKIETINLPEKEKIIEKKSGEEKEKISLIEKLAEKEKKIETIKLPEKEKIIENKPVEEIQIIPVNEKVIEKVNDEKDETTKLPEPEKIVAKEVIQEKSEEFAQYEKLIQAYDRTERKSVKIVEKPELKEKTEKSEDLTGELSNQTTEIKHKKIVGDFFNIPDKEKTEKTLTEKEKTDKISLEKEKEEIIRAEKAKEEKQKVEKISELKERKEIVIQKDSPEFKEIKEERRRIFIPKKEPVKLIETEAKIEDQKIEEKADTEETYKSETEEITLIQKEKTETLQPTKEVVEEPVNKITTETKEETTSVDTMTSIFSKIRQIKKEMNIESVPNRETIDINPNVETQKIIRIKKTDDTKGGGRVIKESFIGFDESKIKTQDLIENTNKTIEKTEKSETDKPETEEIKTSGITAKDLFKQHIQEKEEADEKIKTTEEKPIEIESSNSKLSETLNQIEQKEEKIEIQKKEESKEEQKITEPLNEIVSTPTGEESAADALLRRIAEKKRKMHEEKEKEEAEKLQKKDEMLPLVEEKLEIHDIKMEEETKDFEIKKEPELIEPVSEIEIAEVELPKNNKTQDLIDNFIEKADKLERLGSKEAKIVGDISEKSTEDKDEFMTETMADLFVKQKNYTKAIEIYNKLILKFPEKKTYFAIQIKKAESLIK